MSRTPYGRVGMLSRATGVPFAERGFNVLIQSVRGTHGGSGGKWEPFVSEEKDGLATLDWIENQPWYNGKLFTFGPSYVGMTQLAVLPGAGNRIAGAMPMITGSSLADAFFPRGAFFTALAIQWIRRMTLLERSSALADFIEIIGDKRAQNAMLTVPLKDADVKGADEWRTYGSFPPVGTTPQRWDLQPSGGFGVDADGIGPPRRFRWDPADPTPDYGGAMLDPKLSGRKEQAGREARPDVLVYSSEPLVAPFEVIGQVSATIKVRTSVPFGDVFVRLCDVDENGVSVNVCDGIQRLDALPLPDEDGVREVFVRMWPTAYQFGAGHRLRVQVCGGSFPHFARNTGSGEPLGEATTFVPVDFEILAGSSLTLSATPIDGDRV
jgi:predicted acyl esterase